MRVLRLFTRVETIVLLAEIAFVFGLRFLADGLLWDVNRMYDDRPLPELVDFYLKMPYGPYAEILILLISLYSIDLVRVKRDPSSSVFLPTSAAVLLFFASGYIVAIKLIYLTWIGLATRPPRF